MKLLGTLVLSLSFASVALAGKKVIRAEYQTIDLGAMPAELKNYDSGLRFDGTMTCQTTTGLQYTAQQEGFSGCLLEKSSNSRDNQRSRNE